MVSSNPNSHVQESEQAFRQYFHDLVDAVLDPLVSKAREYGTIELEQLGGVFRTTQGFGSSNAQANLQVATWFYAQGKAARWTAAVRRGETPSADTVLDLMVYCMMYLKVTETGEWWSDISEKHEKVSPSASESAPAPQAQLNILWGNKEYVEGRTPRKINPSINLED